MNPISSVVIPVITGSGAPDNAIGRDNQYYYDGLNGMMYGPKAGGAWPAGVRLQDNITAGTATGQMLVYNSVSGKFEPPPVADICWDFANTWLQTKKLYLDNGTPPNTESMYIRANTPTAKYVAYRTVGVGFAFDIVNMSFQNDINTANLINIGVFGSNNIGGVPALTYMYFGLAYNNTYMRIYPAKITIDTQLGINNTNPVRRLDIIDNASPQSRLGYSSTVYKEEKVDSAGDVTIYQTGDETFYSGLSTGTPTLRTIYSVKRTMPVSTDASRTGLVEVFVNDFAGSRKAIAFGANGTESVLGFHGVTPIVRQNHIADAETATDTTDIVAKYNALVSKFNTLLAICENYGLIKTS